MAGHNQTQHFPFAFWKPQFSSEIKTRKNICVFNNDNSLILGSYRAQYYEESNYQIFKTIV